MLLHRPGREEPYTMPANDAPQPDRLWGVKVELPIARAGIGLAQGLGLLALKRLADAPGEEGAWLMGAAVVFALLPSVLLAGLGAMPLRALGIWSGVGALLLFGLGYYAEWRAEEPEALLLLGPLLLFVLHHLVQVSATAGRLGAPYPLYFDLTWKHGVQLALAVLFTGVLWLLLILAAALFNLIGIAAIEQLIRKDWFYFPVTTVSFSLAVHLTDVRANLVIGARGLALTLLSWLLPLLVLVVGAFLIALVFTGFEGLWGGRLGSGALLWAAVALIFLLNAAYQAGERPQASVVAWAVRGSAVLLAPLVVLAAIGVWQRVAQHGLTPSRVMAAAGLIVLCAYAGVYLVAALSRGAWMARLGGGNVLCAGVSAAVLLGLLTPLADPARLSVDSQMARLARGRIEPETFDFWLLARAGRYGEAALATLQASTGDERAERIAAAARQAAVDVQERPEAANMEQRRTVAPLLGDGEPLPDQAYRALEDGSDPVLDCMLTRNCAFRRIDLIGDAQTEIVLFQGGSLLVLEPGTNASAPWRVVAEGCCAGIEGFRAAPPQPITPPYPDLQIGPDRLVLRPR